MSANVECCDSTLDPVYQELLKEFPDVCRTP